MQADSRRPLFMLLSASLLLVAGLAPFGADSPPEARWAPGVHHLGDPVSLTFSMPLPSPDYFLEGSLRPGADWGKARVAGVRQDPPETFPGPLLVTITVQVFATGSVTLPPAEVVLQTHEGKQGFAVTPPPLTITPTLSPGDQPRPPAAPPLSLPVPFPLTALLLALLVLAGAALLVLVAARLRRRRREAVAAAPDPRETNPEGWIRRELEAIFTRDLAPADRFELLSLRLREYLKLVTGIPFVEWTTGEVRRGLGDLSYLERETSEDLLWVFGLADLVLFARLAPSDSQVAEARKRSFRALDSIRSSLPLLEKAS